METWGAAMCPEGVDQDGEMMARNDSGKWLKELEPLSLEEKTNWEIVSVLQMYKRQFKLET